MPQMTRRLEIDYGHRLMKHAGKCRNYHGHRGIVEVTCSADTLDEVGVVLDFSVVKQVVGGWLDEHWDHGMILETGDPLLPFLQGLTRATRGAQFKVFEVDCAPTSENLVRILFEKSVELLKPYPYVRVDQVKLYETPNCSATYPSRGDVIAMGLKRSNKQVGG